MAPLLIGIAGISFLLLSIAYAWQLELFIRQYTEVCINATHEVLKDVNINAVDPNSNY